jgi:flagellin
MPVINTNVAANSAVYYLNQNAAAESSALSMLSSGSKLIEASDDPAGLAISTQISSDVTTLQQAATNASQATSILQTADGGASNISDILARMQSLASEASSGTVTDSSRTYIQSEFTQLSDEIDSIASGTSYGGQGLLDGTSDFSGSGVSVMVGSSASDTITVTIGTLTTTKLGLVGSIVTGTGTAATTATGALINVSTQSAAIAALSVLGTAVNTVSAARANIGAEESRFNFSANQISTQTQNLQSANSAITDVDVAQEESKLSTAEVKTQAAVSAETAANQLPQYLLKLLG